MQWQIDTATLYWLLGGFASGALLSALIAAIFSIRRIGRVSAERDSLAEKLLSQRELSAEREHALQAASHQLRVAFDNLANESLRSNSDSFLRLARENLGQFQTQANADLTARSKAIDAMIKPIAEALAETRQQLQRSESERQQSFGAIDQHLQAVRASHDALQLETNKLVNALQRPDVGGQWGEITLRRIVELAGMVEHCDFVEQPSVSTSDGVSRPDMLIRLPDRGQIVVDAKTPLDAYLAAAQATDDAQRKQALQRHAKNLRARVRGLAARNYWAQFDDSPDFVIMFVPGDQFLAAGLAEDPALLEDALALKILPVTPTSFIGLLKAIAYGWRQSALTDNAEKIRDLAEELYKRLATFTEHLSTVGTTLMRSVEAYNRAVGSLERSVLPGARRFTEMGIAEKKPLASLDPVEKAPRQPVDTDTPISTREDPGHGR